MTDQPTTTTSYFIESRPAGTDQPWEQTGLRFSWRDPAKSDEKLAWARRQQPEREHRLVTRTTVVTEQPTADAPAAAAVPSVPADADLRERVAAALFEYSNPGFRWIDASPRDRAAFSDDASAFLAVLPTPAAVLRGAADGWTAHCPEHSDSEEVFMDCPCYWADDLRRKAAEAPQAEAHPAEHTWAAELHDPVADEWVPGTRYTARDRAVNHLDHANTVGPTWKDGTPTRRRLVRATTTYTVEQPADETQQEADRA